VSSDPETLRLWMQQAERDTGGRAGITAAAYPLRGLDRFTK